ncbi:MAG: hypothetical protein JXA62_09075 [Candidatus Aminicenantes bacterium]|nr:hypothetical protein [Candidatus Aminicenantes bacterium]
MGSCRLIAVFSIFLVLAASFAGAAVYKDQNLDGVKFRALIRLQEGETEYRCTVVFNGKAANIVLDLNQVLPMVPRNDRFMTLYLLAEEIADPQKITAKLVTEPPEGVDEPPPPEEWPARSLWWIRIGEPLPDQAVES